MDCDVTIKGEKAPAADDVTIKGEQLGSDQESNDGIGGGARVDQQGGKGNTGYNGDEISPSTYL